MVQVVPKCYDGEPSGQVKQQQRGIQGGLRGIKDSSLEGQTGIIQTQLERQKEAARSGQGKTHKAWHDHTHLESQVDLEVEAEGSGGQGQPGQHSYRKFSLKEGRKGGSREGGRKERSKWMNK